MRIILNLPAKRIPACGYRLILEDKKEDFSKLALPYSLPYPSPPWPIPSLPRPAVNKIVLDPGGMAGRDERIASMSRQLMGAATGAAQDLFENTGFRQGTASVYPELRRAVP
jgi:hypothetical protein